MPHGYGRQLRQLGDVGGDAPGSSRVSGVVLRLRTKAARKSESPIAKGRVMGTRQSWLRAAGAQRLKPPENDSRVTVCLPLAPRDSGWNLWPIYEEILEDEPALAAIERTATTTAHKLARH